MKKKLAVLTGVGIVFILAVVIFGCKEVQNTQSEDTIQEAMVLTNEIEQHFTNLDTQNASDGIDHLRATLKNIEMQSQQTKYLILVGGISILFLFVVMGYVYCAILRPFEKMKAFAGKIARGDFEDSLRYERSNYFGEFTWAFDSMRTEIIKARACEKEAIENNKTVIATLSHDIKTPIASIRAYTEGLEANMDTTPQKRAMYLSVMMRKCDEVAKLTEDLFLHSLSDMEKIKIETEEIEIIKFMEDAIGEFAAEYPDIAFEAADMEVLIKADKKRLRQIMENIINNARKYAKSQIDIKAEQKGKAVEICFRDYGPGIPDEDIPFIFDKFYRGKNCGEEQGSGLGLYIVKYLVEKMDGEVQIQNLSVGMMLTLIFPIKGESS